MRMACNLSSPPTQHCRALRRWKPAVPWLLSTCLILLSASVWVAALDPPQKPVVRRILHWYNWTLFRTSDGTLVTGVTAYKYPTLRFDLCDLLGQYWPEKEWKSKTALGPTAAKVGLLPLLPPSWTLPGCGTLERERALAKTQFYACPEKGSYWCGGQRSFYCALWGCVLEASWKHASPKIDLRRGSDPGQDCALGSCNPMVLQIEDSALDDKEWCPGENWGLRLYVSGPDPGVLFTIKRRKGRHRLTRDLGN